MSASVLSIASMGLGAFGSLQKGDATSSSYAYNAAIARRNADLAIQQGGINAAQQAVAAQRKMGSMIAAGGASGATTDSGSFLDVLADSTRQAVLDQQITQYNARVKAAGYLADASLDDAAASNATTSSYFGAGSSIVSGLSSLAQAGALKIPWSS